ncbi:MAG: hypothetical protein BGO29_10660 [Bacteroidales bacterium 36-12]|jgi:DNA-binding response OmpR family regulator|nr:MAG: hypothetical protein BGO29_10660 [Bacteroidales bacterium 36-12]
MKKVLLVEDDINLGTTLKGILEINNFTVCYSDGSEIVSDTSKQFKPDIIIMDVLLPNKKNGFQFAENIRRQKNQVPILFITALDGASAIKKAFSFKNSDYVNKPFKVQEVLLRIHNLLAERYSFNFIENYYKIGNSVFFPKEQIIVRDQEEWHLNKYQARVLIELIKHRGLYVKKSVIIEEVWGLSDYKSKENSLNNILSGLRKCFITDPSVKIKNVIKLGISLSVNEE